VKKIRGDKPIGVIIHTYMEISQGNSLYLKLKCYVFHFMFSLRQNWGKGGQNKSCSGQRAGTSGKGEVMGKRGRKVNTVKENVYTCM
jgi:hypothetical protein